MSHQCDPHLRKQEEFGVPGNTVRSGKHTYVGCIVIGAPPHSNCPMYKENMARHEKMYRRKIVNSGEYGTRDNTIKRLGFHFKDKKKEKIKKCQETEDKDLKSLAFKWSLGEPSQEKKESDKKARAEGEEYAAKLVNITPEEKKISQIKKRKKKKKIKLSKLNRSRVTKINSKPMNIKLVASSAAKRVYICAKRMLRT